MVVQIGFVRLFGIHAESIAVFVDLLLGFVILKLCCTRQIIDQTKDEEKRGQATILGELSGPTDECNNYFEYVFQAWHFDLWKVEHLYTLFDNERCCPFQPSESSD